MWKDIFNANISVFISFTIATLLGLWIYSHIKDSLSIKQIQTRTLYLKRIKEEKLNIQKEMINLSTSLNNIKCTDKIKIKTTIEKYNFYKLSLFDPNNKKYYDNFINKYPELFKD